MLGLEREHQNKELMYGLRKHVSNHMRESVRNGVGAECGHGLFYSSCEMDE